MIKNEELVVMKAVSICFKPFLKPEEALIYCNLGRTQFAKKCDENRIYKSNGGYYSRDDLNRMMQGVTDTLEGAKIKLREMKSNRK